MNRTRAELTRRGRHILAAIGLRSVSAEERARRQGFLRVMERRNTIAERPIHMPRFRVTGAIRMSLDEDEGAAVFLEPGTMIHYSHRGPLQIFDDRERAWMVSHRFVLPDGRQASCIESWSQGAPDVEAVCRDPFPPKGLERLADDEVVVRA
jgi:hypothetical protein